MEKSLNPYGNLSFPTKYCRKMSIIMIFIAQIPYNFFQVNLTVQSPHKDLGIIGISNFEILSFTNKLLKKIVIHRILNINSGSAKTYFTLVQKRASNQSFDSLTQCSKIKEIVQYNINDYTSKPKINGFF